MAFERRACSGADPGDPIAFWRRRLSRVQRGLRRVEDSLEKAVSDFDRLADDIETGTVRAPGRTGRTAAERLPSPVATEFATTGTHTVRFVVHGVPFHVESSPVRMDLLAVLKMPTKTDSEDLVGFKTMGSLVQALRARGWNATRRSVTVEVSRLRTDLGSTNQRLIETRRGLGYRFRLLRSAATPGPGTLA